MRIGPHKKIAVHGDFFEKVLIFSVGTFVDFSEMILWLVLTRATLISTIDSIEEPSPVRSVNALTRATLISTDFCTNVLKSTMGCQCPHTGNTHFYVIYGSYTAFN